MVQVRIKRVYEDFSETDGYRVLVDKLWPRGIKKEWSLLHHKYSYSTEFSILNLIRGCCKIDE